METPVEETAGEVIEDTAALYIRLTTLREPFLTAARESAKYTIPSLMVPEGHAPGAALYRPYQSVGAEGVNTLAMKVVGTIFPENTPMFRFSVTDGVIEELADATQRAAIEKKLNEIERTVMDSIEGEGTRAGLITAIKQLVVSGNVLIYMPKGGQLKVYKLDRYVVQRDYEGNLLRVVIKETVARETLPQSAQNLLNLVPQVETEGKTSGDITKEVDVYTVFQRDGQFLKSHQEINGMVLPASMGRWPLAQTPLLALRWNYLSDEDYGRGHVEEFMGDIVAIENINKNIREAIAASAKVNPMVNPTGLTRAKDVEKAQNLEIISGRADDVTMLQLNKHADLKVAMEFLETITARIRAAFMMNRSAQRSAERVTATEISEIISDIDQVLGGVYSLLANDLQKPLVLRKIYQLEKEKKIPNLSQLKGADGQPVATPRVVTGVDAIGRGHDYNRYMTIARDVIIPMKEVTLPELHVADFMKRLFVSQSIDIDGLLKTPEDKAQAQQQAQGMQQQAGMQEMLQSVVKGATPTVAKAVTEGSPQE